MYKVEEIFPFEELGRFLLNGLAFVVLVFGFLLLLEIIFGLGNLHFVGIQFGSGFELFFSPLGPPGVGVSKNRTSPVSSAPADTSSSGFNSRSVLLLLALST